MQQQKPKGFNSSSYGIAKGDARRNEGIGDSQTGRVLGRQLSPSTIRGNMTIVGTLTLSDPNTNNQVIVLEGGAQTIIVKDPILGITRIIIGKMPDDTYGVVISKPGIDVYSAFS